MNCFFCHSSLFKEDTYCYNATCGTCKVVHQWNGLYQPKLRKVEFLGDYKGKQICISYSVEPHPLSVLKEERYCTVHEITTNPNWGRSVGESPSNWKKLIELPYPPITLTPTNYQEKLATYLLFS